MRIGFTEILVIVIIALALIKPEKLKEYSTMLGKTFRTIKTEKEKAEAELIQPIKDDIDSVKEPIDEMVQPIKDIKNIIDDVKI